jgi:hypothetical protein
VGLHDLGEIDDGGIVEEPGSVGGILDDTVQAPGMDLLAIVVEDESHESVFGFAGLVDDGSGEKLREGEAAVGRPAVGADGVGEGRIAADKFFSREEAATLAVALLEPDVVALEIVDLGFEKAADGVDDATVRSVGEAGDVFVDGLERLVEIDILRAGGRKGTTAGNCADERAETAKPPETAAGTGAGTSHGLGCGAV